MFHQILRPIGDSLPLSFLVAVIPIAIVLAMLGVLRRPAWQASLVGLASGLLIASWPGACRSAWRSTPPRSARSSRCGR